MKPIIKELIRQALETAGEQGALSLSDFPDIVVEEPKDKSMGDYSTTVAMALARSEKKKPRDIAETICAQLRTKNNTLTSVDIAGPGFINLKMDPSFYWDQLKSIAEQGEAYGQSTQGEKRRVLLEFVSANPTGPLHVGHGRGAAVGDMLGAILDKAGYDVDKEYYVNDVGNQMNTLGRSTWYRYRQILGENVEFPEDHYQGDYIKDIAQQAIDEYGDSWLKKPEDEVLAYFKEVSGQSILDTIKKDLQDFGVEFDRWFSEKSLYNGNGVDEILARLREREIIYDKDNAVWLKSSDFNDEKDRVVIKQSGEKTYFCSDIAYHQNKIERGYDWIVNIWGADHHGYVARMQAVVASLGFSLDAFKTLLVQFVTLKRGGEKVSMSTRSGEFITLEEVVSEVGVDATRFFFLMRSSDTHLDFDLELAKQETPENPVFYIQYAHARICRIFETAGEKGVELGDPTQVELSPLKEPEDIELIKKLLTWTEVIEKSAAALEVHRIAHYLHELVGIFHSYYSKHRVVEPDDPGTSRARLCLLHCVRAVIRSGLDLLGVSAPDKM